MCMCTYQARMLTMLRVVEVTVGTRWAHEPRPEMLVVSRWQRGKI